jgi:hypothetical protein
MGYRFASVVTVVVDLRVPRRSLIGDLVASIFTLSKRVTTHVNHVHDFLHCSRSQLIRLTQPSPFDSDSPVFGMSLIVIRRESKRLLNLHSKRLMYFEACVCESSNHQSSNYSLVMAW